jgi:periplasmic protein TonB
MHSIVMVMPRRLAKLLALALLASACSSPPPRSPAGSAGTAPPASSSARSYGSVMDYRQAAGNAIYAANTAIRSTGTLPALLRAIVVLEVEVDSGGKVAVARIKRGGADSSLNSVAIESLRRASLPAPSRNLLNRRGTVEYLETWFFDNEGRFQLMAFNPPQSRQ